MIYLDKPIVFGAIDFIPYLLLITLIIINPKIPINTINPEKINHKILTISALKK